MVDQPQIVGAGAVIDIRQFCRAGGVALEQFSVVPPHDVQMPKQIPGKLGTIISPNVATGQFGKFAGQLSSNKSLICVLANVSVPETSDSASK